MDTREPELEHDDSTIVRLNIGGMQFCAMKDVFFQRDQDSMFAAMFSGRHNVNVHPKTGSVFVDRDGTHFRHVLNWLRDGSLPYPNVALYHELYREAEYYQLTEFMEALNKTLAADQDDENKPELTRKEVILCLQNANVRLRGVNLSGADLSKLDLARVDFSYSRLVGTFFSRTDLQGATFKEAQCDRSIFLNAHMRECHFEKATLKGAMLAGCLLQSANMQDACLERASLVGANLSAAHLQNADFTDADLSGADLEGANLKNAKLSGTILKGANLQRAYLKGVDLTHTNLEDAKLGGANLIGAMR